MNRNDLEERLINFATCLLEIIKLLPDNKVTKHLSSQLLRSGTSAALNYGEAQSGESRKDFIHKINIVLKELRESSICIKLIQRCNPNESDEKIKTALKENNELISIFVKSIETAKKNRANN